ncbi:MAG: NAD(+) synthase [Bacteroidaceae bacterium]|nr:NAD(+) synthase [Bacteroidaceae bacterium]
MMHGFIKTATAVPTISVGDIHSNAKSIIALIEKASALDAEIVLFPELCLTSGTCGDLLTQPHYIIECENALAGIAEATKDINTIAVIGTPVAYRNSTFNCAAVIHKGEISAIVPKNILCNRGVANESRRFASGTAVPTGSKVQIAGKDIPFEPKAIFSTPSCSFGIEIGSESESPIPTGAMLAVAGAEIILNPSSQNEEVGSTRLTRERMRQQSLRLKCGYLLSNSGWGESTSHAVYSGYSAIAECGSIIAESKRFIREGHITVSEIDVEKIRKERMSDSAFAHHNELPYIYINQEKSTCTTLTRAIDPAPFIPSDKEKSARFDEIFMIQATALARRIEHTRSRSALIGISGGLDSTLALLVAVKAFDILGRPHSDIITVTMPGFGTSGRTYSNAMELMKSLGTTIKEVSIKDACIQHFKDIGHDIDSHDITYENSQARERTQILMDIANQQNGIVIGTGDMSELALGWATYNGDHMSMYGVNASVPKTLMQHLIRWVAKEKGNEQIAKTLLDIVGTPISPELTPADEKGNIKQKTEDLVGPYELHDFFLYNFICNGYSPAKIYFLAQKAFNGTYDDETIKKWLKTFMWRFFTQQFKRSCMPDGPKTGCCSLDAQGWNMPSDTSPAMFARMCDEIENDKN